MKKASATDKGFYSFAPLFGRALGVVPCRSLCTAFKGQGAVYAVLRGLPTPFMQKSMDVTLNMRRGEHASVQRRTNRERTGKPTGETLALSTLPLPRQDGVGAPRRPSTAGRSRRTLMAADPPLHSSAMAETHQRRLTRGFWRVLTEIRDRRRGRRPLLRCKPGVSPGRPPPPRRISQAGPGRKRISVKTRQKLPSSLSDRRRTEGGTRSAEDAEEEDAGGEGRHALGEGANAAGTETPRGRTSQSAEGPRPSGGKRRARRQTANPAEKASQREGPSRSRASASPRPRARGTRGPRMRYTRSIDRTRPR